jgi:hypothetical protein
MRAPLPTGLALAGLASLAALNAGCAMSIPETPPYPPAYTQADPVPGAVFCARTETAARSLASSQAAGGWVLASLGIASVGGGAIATLVNVQESRRIAGTAITLGGVAMGAAALALLMRADASSRLAQAANAALLQKNDREAWEACVRAKSAWAGSKSSADGITQEMLAQKERENRRLEDEIKQLEKRAAEGGKAPQDLPPPLAPRR